MTYPKNYKFSDFRENSDGEYFFPKFPPFIIKNLHHLEVYILIKIYMITNKESNNCWVLLINN